MAGKDNLNSLLLQAPTPCFVVDEEALERNIAILAAVQRRAGCRILLALKAFAMWSVFPLLKETLKGVCASSPHEARLGREYFGGEVHAFAAAYSEEDILKLIDVCDHIVFNSFSQLERFRALIEQSGADMKIGLRMNPEHSEAPATLYDPCAPFSRLGIRREEFQGKDLSGVSGLHFHTLCEQNSDALERTLAAFEKRFSDIIPMMQWINFGGGHHITRSDYDVDLLCDLIAGFAERYGKVIYLEPGEAVALNAGYLVSTVLDIVRNEMDIAILDTSAAAHMPDVLEMPYRPEVVSAGGPGQLQYSYRLAGLSCLAGDVIGDYSFDEPLRPGAKIVFTDMAHYTMVKTNTFNGIGLPSIAVCRPSKDHIEIIRRFGYEDFKNRLS
ncbi:MAG: carboxynorspermidine decarboxylase [Deltaproteobacteria bacterium CG_4_8_14_3_um_filter_51_11]|nr:carboxynorspermidine decarboxylase [bacterium]OIP42761.1 MAG: carboxynorspermidine decarboxylase [Desulfobacteraceae bacterium CG2_30_51_40]PIP46663.1 MAG: carboxynorspermidine decarboxylase [Deltaproteobacteria bacterium CG23_combo_of_CG06-09_8_20_14_all_51_20]PIX18704.1 MAG: carboxynorspermidine decarboxylase [Deltaproteobacteria bacterium CG_4_8_14_3_um_filter_51_11]PIY22715.1 MAG: carboxynorspermidine decarboxylase [Deltaproteobacteria bacterium CG_4_10_14_3_um_filter_51_14]PJB34659.1 M